MNSQVIDLARLLVGGSCKVIGKQKTFIGQRPKLRIDKELTTDLTAQSSKEMGEVTVDDATLFLAKFTNGALGSFEATRFANGRRNGLRLEINGSKGSLMFEQENMKELCLYS